MDNKRYKELMHSDAPLTEGEIREGWRFCGCEWDGLLVNVTDIEGEGTICPCHRVPGEYTSMSKSEVKGRGNVIGILIDYEITYREVNGWVGKYICIDGEVHEIKGVETFKPNEDMLCDRAGILI